MDPGDRCIHCRAAIERDAFICWACGRVQPPEGEGPDWWRREVDRLRRDRGDALAPRPIWLVAAETLSLVRMLLGYGTGAVSAALGLVFAVGLLVASIWVLGRVDPDDGGRRMAVAAVAVGGLASIGWLVRLVQESIG